MGTTVAIIVGIVMLMVLVVIHELGHFWAAKKLGVKVLEFGVGIPPKAAKLWTDKGGTEYTLNWIPLGGFVRLKGEDPDDEADFLATDSLITAPLRRKIVILLGGIAMNFLTTYLIFVVVLMRGVTPISVLPDATNHNTSYLTPTLASLHDKGYIIDDPLSQPVIVEEIVGDSWAATQGLTKGDMILHINGQSVSPFTLTRTLTESKGKDVTIAVQQADGQTRDLTYTCEDACQLGVAITTPQINTVSLGAGARGAAWYELKYQSSAMLNGLGRIGASLISFDRQTTVDGLKMMSGPAGVIKAGQNIANTRGRSAYLAFAGMISLSLALFNLLPIPALDGGRVVGSIIQSVGRFKPQKYFVIEGMINSVFFLALMGLGIYILGQDLIRVWGIFG